jgi:hypothetical protein
MLYSFQEINLYNYVDYLLENSWISTFKSIFSKLKDEQGVRYIKLKHRRELNQMLVLFVRSNHLLSIRSIQVQVLRFGILNMFPNKAAIGVRFTLGQSPICFVSAHLTAHAHNYTRRLYEYNLITDHVRFDEARSIGPTNDLFSFIFGDLNFRLEQFPDDLWSLPVDYSKTYDYELIQQLLGHDQLKLSQTRGEAFAHFQESTIDFMPTYKYVTNRQQFSSKRKPAYTDRILFKKPTEAIGHNLLSLDKSHQIRTVKYSSLGEFTQSDHRPVFGVFDLILPGAELLTKTNKPNVQVRFLAPTTWKAFQDNEILFTFESTATEPTCDAQSLNSDDLHPNIWDWIGLYRSDFGSLDDYEAFVYVNGEAPELAEEAHESSTGDRLSAESLSASRSSDAGESRVFSTVFTYINLQPAEYLLLYVRHDGSAYGQSAVFCV